MKKVYFGLALFLFAIVGCGSPAPESADIEPIALAAPTSVPKVAPEPTLAPPASSQSLEQAFPVQEAKPSKRGSRVSRSQSSRPRTSESSQPRPTPVALEPQQGGQVWVNTKSKGHVYHLPGMRWYGKTRAGYFTSEEQAKKDGYRQAER